MQKVSLIILNWNRKKLTLECLESVEKLVIRNYKLQIIVVDNASEDGSQEVVGKKLKDIEKKRKNVSVKLIENQQNYGFAKGNNMGMKYALENRSDFIMLLNNDTIVDRNLVVEFLKVIRKHSRVGVMSPKIYFAKGYEFHKGRYKKEKLGKVIWYAGGDIDWANVCGINHGVDEVDRGQYDKDRETDFATGTCMFFKKEALEDVGLFDEKYFMYMEDVDLSIRLGLSGWNIMYIPKAIVWHKVAQSSGIGSELNDYFISRNRLLFGIRYASLKTKFALAKESARLLFSGRLWQKVGVRDFYLGKFGRGSWK